jgi:hypothetical protein
MKAANMSMGARVRRVRLSLTLLAAGLTAVAAGTAIAQVAPASTVGRSRHVGSPKVLSKTHQPVGTPHKASSFAPHPTKRRVFGAPIQAPIVSSAAPKKHAPK